MVVSVKDTLKLFGISIMCCCAVFVCTLFLNYNLDLATIKNELTTEMALTMYEAQRATGKVTSAVSGGCLVLTSVVMLLFHIKNYVDTHSKELGILKALGYSNCKIAIHFWVFGLSVLVGCVLGYAMGYAYLPNFYKAQNNEAYFPKIAVNFHPMLTFALVLAPAIVFAVIAILYSFFKLKSPALDLLREKRECKTKINKKEKTDVSFLKYLQNSTVKTNKTLVFFVAFSAFCFSAMVQMSVSMRDLASETMAAMILAIGLILAFTTLFLSLSNVVKGNTKTIAMMRVFGYEHNICARAVLGGYRPFSYVGFVIGSIYQWGLLKIMVTVVFADVANVPEYHFDFVACAVTLALFIASYELTMLYYAHRLKRLPLKSVMLEQ